MGLRNVHVRVDHGWWKRFEPADYALSDAGRVAVFVTWRRRPCSGGRGPS